MKIPIIVEPHGTGFRASTVAVTADAPTAEAAVLALHELVQTWLLASGNVQKLYVDDADELEARRALAENPMWDQFLDAIRENREQEELEERVLEQSSLDSPHSGV